MHGSLYAQKDTVLQLTSIQLPPIEKLYEGARSTPSYEFYDSRNKAEELILKSTKRHWLSYFNFFGTYQYGVLGMDMYNNEGAGTPLIYQYSGSNQMWYNFGGSIRISLDNLFDGHNKVKTQKQRVIQTSLETQQWYDSQKIKIIDLYNKANELLSVLKYTIEQASLADVQYEMAQKDYISGNSTSQALNNSKGQQVQAYMQLERVKSELLSSIMQLEILSNTNIIKR